MIGVVSDSCFIEKWSTPRQGGCVQGAEAIIRISDLANWRRVSAYKVILIIFVFHLNVNKRAIIGGQNFAGLRARISAPRLSHGKVGCFASRSPDRPNPIGLTPAVVTSSDESSQTIRVMGVDLIKGTPIVDIQEYVYGKHYIDNPRVPKWVDSHLKGAGRLRVNVSLAVPMRCRALNWSHAETDAGIALMTNVLAEDPRSRRSRAEHPTGLFAHVMEINRTELMLVYKYHDQEIAFLSIWPRGRLPAPLGSLTASAESLRSPQTHKALLQFFDTLLPPPP